MKITEGIFYSPVTNRYYDSQEVWLYQGNYYSIESPWEGSLIQISNTIKKDGRNRMGTSS